MEPAPRLLADMVIAREGSDSGRAMIGFPRRWEARRPQAHVCKGSEPCHSTTREDEIGEEHVEDLAAAAVGLFSVSILQRIIRTISCIAKRSRRVSAAHLPKELGNAPKACRMVLSVSYQSELISQRACEV